MLDRRGQADSLPIEQATALLAPGTVVSVHLSAASEGSEHVARLSVADNGPGIPADLLPEAFERFTRGDTSRSRAHGSSGLGLAIVAAIVEAHLGGVEVSSEPGRTHFTIILPRFTDPTAVA